MTQFVGETGNYKNLTATGVVTAGPGSLIGFYVNSTSSGTIALKDGGSSGTAMGGTITPAIGFHRYPGTFGKGGLYATIASTLDVTLFYIPGGAQTN